MEVEQLSWGGQIGAMLYPVYTVTLIVAAVVLLLMILESFTKARTVGSDTRLTWIIGTVIAGLAALAASSFLLGSNAYGALAAIVLGIAGTILAGYAVLLALCYQRFDLSEFIKQMFWVASLVLLALTAIWIVGILFAGPNERGILGWAFVRFWPVWISMIVVFAVSIWSKNSTGLYGRLFESTIGMIGFGLVLFWVLTAIFADTIMTHESLSQISGMKNKVPGTPVRGAAESDFQWYLFGGDNLARDVFSRMVAGSRVVLIIAPLATLFAFMVGITLGLAAGYLGNFRDTSLSFLANLVLSFPVILLFFLLVTPEIRAAGYEIPIWSGKTWVTSIPNILAAVLFVFPIIFFCILWQSKYYVRPGLRNVLIAVTLAIGLWLYSGLTFNADPFGILSMTPNMLNIFVSVVFVNSPTVFRIVRGLTLDLKTRDYVAAAQTRGEGPWYIMLWEILPNARGPLIVDFCLRIGYTTILLGTLGFFGLGLSPESPDWGSTINDGRKLLTIYAHPALPPALALMSLVLGLNLLADGLREQSLKD